MLLWKASVWDVNPFPGISLNGFLIYWHFSKVDLMLLKIELLRKRIIPFPGCRDMKGGRDPGIAAARNFVS
jgi:hypothetical protein